LAFSLLAKIGPASFNPSGDSEKGNENVAFQQISKKEIEELQIKIICELGHFPTKFLIDSRNELIFKRFCCGELLDSGEFNPQNTDRLPGGN